MCSQVNAGGPGSETRKLGRWARGPAAAEGSVARRGLVSTQVVAGAVSFPLAGRHSAKRRPRVRARPIPIRTGFYTRTATLPFSPLPSSPSLPFPSSQSHPRRPSPNPNGIHTCLRRRRGAVLGAGRRGGPAVSDPGPAPLGRVIRGHSRELKGAPFALVGGWGSKWGISVSSGQVAPDELWVLIGANFSSVILVICTLCI